MTDESAHVPRPIPSRRISPASVPHRTARHSHGAATSYTASRATGPAWKRGFDVTFSASALLFLAPLLLLITVGLLVADGRPLFYKQQRIGRNGRMFQCLKFRSMVRDADARLQSVLAASQQARSEWTNTHKLRNDPRIHWMGRILRKTSLDELPQFLNVLRGDMSIVGPRPIVQAEVPRYGTDFIHYKSVRPGITGLWQVSGRNELSYSERVALDARYAKDVTFSEDIRIISKTVAIVASGSGDH